MGTTFVTLTEDEYGKPIRVNPMHVMTITGGQKGYLKLVDGSHIVVRQNAAEVERLIDEAVQSTEDNFAAGLAGKFGRY
ncbi:MAG: hypothetical protein J2P48_07605 [Alphaproteobacteria bacterium]|nr:hypothetical protein [Alphaproteobacteria bacterium]